MNLGAKIFGVFSGFISLLMGLTLYFTQHQAETHEIARITADLGQIQLQFKDRLENQQRQTLKLSQTIVADQKFRSFLDNVKENFYPFMEEIAQDTGGSPVFMVDGDKHLRAIFPAGGASTSWFELNRGAFDFSAVLDEGKSLAHVLTLGGELFSVAYVPLKESLSDDFARGAVIVCNRIDDAWARSILDPRKEVVEIRVAFFSSAGIPVAGNIASSELAGQGRAAALGAPGGAGVFTNDGRRYLARRGLLDEKQAEYVLVAGLDQALEPFRELAGEILLTGIGLLAIGSGFTFLFARRIVHPLKLLVGGTRKILDGEYDFHIAPRSKDEVGQLTDAFNHMVDGLRDKEHIRESFGKYLHPRIVTQLLENPEKLKLGGTRQIQTVLFSDIADFTRFSEKMSPDSLITLLNEYLGAMTEEITRQEGIIDKYIGDAIMAFWNPEFSRTNHAVLACRATLHMQRRLALLRPRWIADGYPEVRARIGLATGEMVVGNLGSEHARNYTCIGDTVNFGSRLEGLNKEYGTAILIDETTCKLARPGIVVREIDTVRVKGREQNTPVFELLGLEEEATQEQRRIVEDYALGLSAYRAGDFAAAAQRFAELHNRFPADQTSYLMYKRCLAYQEHPPQDWTGVHILSSK